MKNIQSRVARRKKRRLKTKFKIIIPILVVLLAIGSYVWYLDSKANSMIKGSHEELDREKSDYREDGHIVDPKTDNVSVLLMGIDSSDTRGNDEIARTDALLVATFNVKDKSVKLLSIPRDSLVYIPIVDKYDKINHAHAFGHKDGKGPTETVRTVENLLEIPIDYYVRLNFEAFIDVVEALGGIDIDVPYEFKEQNSRDQAQAIHLFPGMQRLNGEEALALARTRKKDSDYMRGMRQQEIVKAIAKRAMSVSSIFKYDDVIDAIGENMKTNMTYSEMKSFFSYVTHGKNLNIDNLNIKGDDYKPGHIYYWKLDEESLKEVADEMRAHLGISKRDFSFEDEIEQSKRGYSESVIRERFESQATSSYTPTQNNQQVAYNEPKKNDSVTKTEPEKPKQTVSEQPTPSSQNEGGPKADGKKSEAEETEESTPQTNDDKKTNGEDEVASETEEPKDKVDSEDKKQKENPEAEPNQKDERDKKDETKRDKT